MRLYGLIGNPVAHSLSPDIFARKWEQEGIRNCIYRLFPLHSLRELPELLRANPELRGLNVTSPFKQEVLALADNADETALGIGSANLLSIDNRQRITAYKRRCGQSCQIQSGTARCENHHRLAEERSGPDPLRRDRQQHIATAPAGCKRHAARNGSTHRPDAAAAIRCAHAKPPAGGSGLQSGADRLPADRKTQRMPHHRRAGDAVWPG